ncbi:MAG: protein-glutamine glutaminase family protein [Bdellovibrionota bacterium]
MKSFLIFFRYFSFFFLALTQISCSEITALKHPQIVTVYGEEAAISPAREEDESWETALQSELQKLSNEEISIATSADSVIRSAKIYAEPFDVSRLPEWRHGDAALASVLATLKLERIYKEASRPTFLRRATWLYPRDGCYVRASHSAQSCARAGYERPGKIFAFGSLRLVTPFASGGVQYWSYHVAAAYRIGSTAVILDPVLDPHTPLTLSQWIAKMKYRNAAVKVSVCDTWAYGVNHRCLGGTSKAERSFAYHTKKFLPLEWNNVRARGYDPFKVLGDQPPWFDYFFFGGESVDASFVSPKPLAISEGV